MASNLRAMACNLGAMASNLLAMASNLLAIVDLLAWRIFFFSWDPFPPNELSSSRWSPTNSRTRSAELWPWK